MEADWEERPIPVAMRKVRRWLVWRYYHRGGDKPRKVPYYASGKMRGKGIALDSPQDLANLVTFDEVCEVAGKYSGIGFALGPDASGNVWQGIDLDGIQEAGLEQLAKTLPGYAERSPSSMGLHAIGLGRPFKTLGSNGTGIEAYCAKRYFTVTGDYVRGNLCCLADFVESRLAPLHLKTLHRGTESQESQESHAIGEGGVYAHRNLTI
jgi:primase-polymerase (primpol)-like protein